MRRGLLLLVAVVGLSLMAMPAQDALAHRPYFEEEDLGASDPWLVDDPTISTAIYATLESRQDVDYFAFDGEQGAVILLAMTIPQIEGQEDFAPSLVLMGPGLGEDELPERIRVPDGAGAQVIEPPPGPAPTFFEPFSRTSYWERQEQRVTLPASGRYVVAVWHPDQEVGRYTFVIGEKERLGGDLAFPLKMRSYWTPVEAPAPAEALEPTEPAPMEATPAERESEVVPGKHSCGGW
jgi:hypothetical protein